jgi:hypothetical protein
MILLFIVGLGFLVTEQICEAARIYQCKLEWTLYQAPGTRATSQITYHAMQGRGAIWNLFPVFSASFTPFAGIAAPIVGILGIGWISRGLLAWLAAAMCLVLAVAALVILRSRRHAYEDFARYACENDWEEAGSAD